MKSYLFAVCVAVGLAGDIGAADRPAKVKPDGVKSYDEAAKAFPAGEKMTVPRTRYIAQTVTRQVQVGDKVVLETVTVMVPVTETVVVVVPERKWSLGAEGWHDGEGFNVDKVAAGGPLTKVTVKEGMKDVVKAVAAGDTITKIDRKPVTSEIDLYLALQGAADGEKLVVEVMGKDGTGYEGTVAAKKAK